MKKPAGKRLSILDLRDFKVFDGTPGVFASDKDFLLPSPKFRDGTEATRRDMRDIGRHLDLVRIAIEQEIASPSLDLSDYWDGVPDRENPQAIARYAAGQLPLLEKAIAAGDLREAVVWALLLGRCVANMQAARLFHVVRSGRKAIDGGRRGTATIQNGKGERNKEMLARYRELRDEHKGIGEALETVGNEFELHPGTIRRIFGKMRARPV